VSKGLLGVVLHMELFERSLASEAAALLASPSDWASLLFQVLHGAASASFVFGICHNDVYARNVLVRRCPPRHVTYEIEGRGISFRADFLAVLTDFGIASGELLGAPLAPEVAVEKSLPAVAARRAFAFVAPERHILHYDVPPFSRDTYTALKWPVYGTPELPAAPINVRAWALFGLHRVDASLAAFRDQRAPARFLADLFERRRLSGFGLGDALCEPEGGAPPAFVLSEAATSGLLSQAVEALELARGLEEEWLRTLQLDDVEIKERDGSAPDDGLQECADAGGGG
jgi:hypothetical protein